MQPAKKEINENKTKFDRYIVTDNLKTYCIDQTLDKKTNFVELLGTKVT